MSVWAFPTDDNVRLRASRCNAAMWQVLARSTVTWSARSRNHRGSGAGTHAMIPADQRQLNIAFPKLTMSYVARRDTEHCVWVNNLIPRWLQNFHNDKLLYSGWGKLCI
jgi:hypothetical protein